LSSGIMAAAGRFGGSSDIDIEANLVEKDCKSTTNSTKVALMCLNLLNYGFHDNVISKIIISRKGLFPRGP
jgi:hypothetical protein